MIPGAKRAAVVGRHGERWKVRVTAPPERGAANDAVVRLISDTLGVPARDVTIVSGHGRREKTVDVAGADEARVEAALSSRTKETV